MAVKNQNALIKKLKKRIALLQRREKKVRAQLHSSLKKVQKLGNVYKNKLGRKLREMKGKVAAAEASTYAKTAIDLEKKLLKSIKTKGKALVSAVSKIEKKHASSITRSLAKKGKKAKSKKPARRK